MAWQDRFLDGLVALDIEESPHGLYGIREAYATDAKPLPSLEHILWSPHGADFVRRHGFSEPPQTRIRRSHLILERDQIVSVNILNLASTKVRRFGSTYLLDKSTKKREFEPDWDIIKELTHLSKTSRLAFRSDLRSRALLLIAHAPRLEAVHEFLAEVRIATFLDRYELAFCEREWLDQYGRGFSTGLYLWNTV